MNRAVRLRTRRPVAFRTAACRSIFAKACVFVRNRASGVASGGMILVVC